MAECEELLSESAARTKQPEVVAVGGKALKLPGCELLHTGTGSTRIVAVDHRIYVFGKTQLLDSEGYFQERDRVFKFDLADKRWTDVTKLFALPERHTLFCLPAWPDPMSIYFVSNYYPSNYKTSYVWRFDCNAGTTTMVTSYNESGFHEIGGMESFLVKAKGIFMMDLDSTALSWKKVADLSVRHMIISAAWCNGSLYMVKHPGNTLRCDVATGEVSEMKPLEGGKFLPLAQIVSDGDLLVTLASRDGREETRLVVFDPLNEESGWIWVEAASLPPHLSATGIAFKDGFVYVIGRWREDQRSGELWEIKLSRSQPGVWLSQGDSDQNGRAPTLQGASDQNDHPATLPSNRPGPQGSCQAPGSAGGTGDGDAVTSPLDDFEKLLSSGEFADVMFLVGAERQAVKGHVAIVSSRCPVLGSMIKEVKQKKNEEVKGSKEADHAQCCRLEVDLPEIEVPAFHQALRFIYTGRIERKEGHDIRSEMQLFNAASSFRLEGLRQRCGDNLIRSTTKVDDFIERLQMASSLGVNFAQRFFVSEVAQHEEYKEIVGSPKFYRLQPQLAHSVILEYGRLHGEGTLEDAEPAECLEVPE